MKIHRIHLRAANRFVYTYHRHSRPVVGHKFSLALIDEREIMGVAIVGRPVARGVDHNTTLEVTRLCTLGARNACSRLYGACYREVKRMGYRKLITYTLESENGASLKASGFKAEATVKGRHWGTKKRPRKDEIPVIGKVRWSRGEDT